SSAVVTRSPTSPSTATATSHTRPASTCGPTPTYAPGLSASSSSPDTSKTSSRTARTPRPPRDTRSTAERLDTTIRRSDLQPRRGLTSHQSRLRADDAASHPVAPLRTPDLLFARGYRLIGFIRLYPALTRPNERPRVRGAPRYWRRR